MLFTKDHNEIWKKLFDNQIENVKKYACSEYLEGFKRLALTNEKVPSLKFLNRKIYPLTGWRVIRTKIRYSDTLPWYQHFSKHEFIVTNYLRSKKELDYTPEPDMFHDMFGHLPFLTLPEYTELLDMFTKTYFMTDNKGREDIKRLAWFSYEFGLIKENGKIKAFGTGIISSKGEIEHVIGGNTPILDFTIENVLKRNKAIDYFNKELFVFNSLADLKQILVDYFEKISLKKHNKIFLGKINDREMDLSKYNKKSQSIIHS